MITQNYLKNERIVNEGDQANSYFIIKSGKVCITKQGNVIREMVAGDTFGEQALF
jgi:cGMP-dependent protein kinase